MPLETYPSKEIWENILISVALVQDISFETSIQCWHVVYFFDLEPLILLRRTANNSFLNLQQIFTFTHFPTKQNRTSINIHVLVEGR